MKLYTTMPKALKRFYQIELIAAQNDLKSNNLQSCWRHLERAHIIGQKYPYEHTYVHWKMLQFGIKTKNSKEIIGQVPRLLFGGVKSFVGQIPVGNTGSSNVPPLKPMEMPNDIQEIIKTNS
ncbi:MAG: DUF3703 domain-containing protein [Flavobacterium sp.]